jgi:uncharacterized protein YdeI (YjbR/CyaY-like superfamily)
MRYSRPVVELPELVVRDVAGWRAWLAEHQADAPGVWLVLAEKGTTEPTSLTFDEGLEEAICYGWIDSRSGSRDERTYRLRFMPRGGPAAPGRSATSSSRSG